MSINDKIKNAKTTDWLSEGLSEDKIKKIKRDCMKKDKDFISWKLWRFSIDWFTDNGEWFLYFRYWKPYHKSHKYYSFKISEIRFSSAGFMCSKYNY